MTKTPEELQKIAEEYERSITPAIEDADSIFKHERIRSFQYGYRAGYQAAAAEYQEKLNQIRLDRPAFKKHEIENLLSQANLDGFKRGYEQGKIVQSEWISVKDRMPPPEVEVLWWNETADEAGVSSYKYMSHCNATIIEWGDAGYLFIKNFTHWMPLPAAPEEEK